MAVRSRHLGYWSGPPSASWQVVYTVPTDRTAIVRMLAVSNRSGAALTFALRVRRGAATPIFWNQVGLADLSTSVFPSSELVLNPGDVLEVQATGSGTSNAIVHAAGALLEGAPA